jgi:hypothetical protein
VAEEAGRAARDRDEDANANDAGDDDDDDDEEKDDEDEVELVDAEDASARKTGRLSCATFVCMPSAQLRVAVSSRRVL